MECLEEGCSPVSSLFLAGDFAERFARGTPPNAKELGSLADLQPGEEDQGRNQEERAKRVDIRPDR